MENEEQKGENLRGRGMSRDLQVLKEHEVFCHEVGST